jgi:hypothetical protein
MGSVLKKITMAELRFTIKKGILSKLTQMEIQPEGDKMV